MEEHILKFVAWTKLKIRLHVKPDNGVYFREREIWWASLGANIGYEQDGKHDNFERPILILKKFGRHTLWVLPITSRMRTGSFFYQLDYREKTYTVLLTQLRLISSKRLLRRIRKISVSEASRIKEQLKNLI